MTSHSNRQRSATNNVATSFGILLPTNRFNRKLNRMGCGLHSMPQEKSQICHIQNCASVWIADVNHCRTYPDPVTLSKTVPTLLEEGSETAAAEVYRYLNSFLFGLVSNHDQKPRGAGFVCFGITRRQGSIGIPILLRVAMSAMSGRGVGRDLVET